MSELDPRLQALLDKDAITGVIQELARGTDRLDAEQIESCYHPDGFDDHNSFRGGPREFWEAPRRSPLPRQRFCSQAGSGGG